MEAGRETQRIIITCVRQIKQKGAVWRQGVRNEAHSTWKLELLVRLIRTHKSSKKKKVNSCRFRGFRFASTGFLAERKKIYIFLEMYILYLKALKKTHFNLIICN